MLIPVASESQYRLFGTCQEGQSINLADYSADADAGIRSISTFEFDLEAYIVTSSLHTLISGSGNMEGFAKDLVQPHSFIIPIMQGPHDVITKDKPNSGVSFPGTGGDTGKHAATSNGELNLKFYFSGNARALALYQISYLEETNTLIADINKPTELSNDVGDKGYILIPDNIDKDIRDNLDFYLDKAGLKENSSAERIPNRKE